MDKDSEIPKWKLKANWLLKELIHIWHGHSKPETLFEGRNFVQTFMRLMEQYLRDCGSLAPQAELEICLTKVRLTYAARHGSAPTFASQAMEADWIAETVAIYRLDFELITDETIKNIVRIASAIEDILQNCGIIPSDYLQSVEELLDYPVININELPIMPIEE